MNPRLVKSASYPHQSYRNNEAPPDNNYGIRFQQYREDGKPYGVSNPLMVDYENQRIMLKNEHNWSGISESRHHDFNRHDDHYEDNARGSNSHPRYRPQNNEEVKDSQWGGYNQNTLAGILMNDSQIPEYNQRGNNARMQLPRMSHVENVTKTFSPEYSSSQKE